MLLVLTMSPPHIPDYGRIGEFGPLLHSFDKLMQWALETVRSVRTQRVETYDTIGRGVVRINVLNDIEEEETSLNKPPPVPVEVPARHYLSNLVDPSGGPSRKK
ncbi:unnamed protein product [Lepeophtheirus salmonis]|uniref:(salmon louse) hypothetical protein n=1 Tax=Lepeophtheirus salmonis TaxID=72036 RepID=A0A7R8H8S7_LEPSM|nr:unnamed protein product [Lepeophtheirus salmonis]CAF2944738.1 unnamed protein product [Lepeophtheirus salmonis]